MTGWRRLLIPRIRERVARIELPWGSHGLDLFGVDQDYLAFLYGCFEPLYRSYFKVKVQGLDHVPDRGRTMLIGNHSGGIPFDGMMVLSSLFFDKDPPRHAHGMVEKFAQRLPIVAPFFSRTGQFNGLPANAVRLLHQERILMVFPEGVGGIGKLYKHRYQLQRFGTGFMRIALETGTPIVPFAFIGGEEAFPTVAHVRPLAKLLGVPYFPVPSHILPIPLPRPCEIHYSEPMHFEGTGRERDEVVQELVGRVKARIDELFERAGKARPLEVAR